MSRSAECPVCTKRKPRRWSLCKECLSIYGTTAEGWPDYIKLMVNDARRWDYDERQRREYELPIDDFEIFEESNGDPDEQLWTRPRSEMMTTYGPLGSLVIPGSPYDNEDLNRAYRKANNIPEPPDILIDDADDNADTEAELIPVS